MIPLLLRKETVQFNKPNSSEMAFQWLTMSLGTAMTFRSFYHNLFDNLLDIDKIIK